MTIYAVSSNSTKIGEWKLPNSTVHLDDLIGEFDEPIKAVVEATSSWYWLADWAQSRDIDLVLAQQVNHSPAQFDWDTEWVIDVRSGIVIQ